MDIRRQSVGKRAAPSSSRSRSRWRRAPRPPYGRRDGWPRPRLSSDTSVAKCVPCSPTTSRPRLRNEYAQQSPITPAPTTTTCHTRSLHTCLTAHAPLWTLPSPRSPPGAERCSTVRSRGLAPAEQLATVNDEVGARDEAGIVGGQEERRVGDVLRLAHATEWDALLVLPDLLRVAHRLGRHRRGDQAGRDTVDAHPPARQSQRKVLGQRLEPSLGHVVRARLCAGLLLRHRGNGDDGAAPALCHVPPCRLAERIGAD